MARKDFVGRDGAAYGNLWGLSRIRGSPTVIIGPLWRAWDPLLAATARCPVSLKTCVFVTLSAEMTLLHSLQLYAKISFGLHVSAPQSSQRFPRATLKPLISLHLFAKMSSGLHVNVPIGPQSDSKSPKSPP